MNGGDCKTYNTSNEVKEHIRKNFPYRRSLAAKQLIEETKSKEIFYYVQCYIELPKALIESFANFPRIFKNALLSENDLMETYAEEEGISSQPRKTLI